MIKYHPSITDVDIYKLYMMKAVMQKFPNETVVYTFHNRKNTPFPEGFGSRLRDIVDGFKDITMLDREKENLNDFLSYWDITALDPAFLEFYKNYKYDPQQVDIEQIGDQLSVTIHGYWYKAILWETVLLATISELYYEMTGKRPLDEKELHRINKEKFNTLVGMGAKFIEFGTRRRFSYENHLNVLKDFCTDNFSPNFFGTSNLHFAMMFNIKPWGTCAHEWFQFHAAKYGPTMANSMALNNWLDVFKGDLGIALPDTFTTPVFLRSFDKVLARVFDGTRQDSGDPLKYVDLLYNHYKSLGINPAHKSCMFSDNIKSKDTVQALLDYSKGKMTPFFGIGKWLTNDVGVATLDIVIKLSHITTGGNVNPAIKLSDTSGKHTGNAAAIKLYKEILKIK